MLLTNGIHHSPSELYFLGRFRRERRAALLRDRGVAVQTPGLAIWAICASA